MTAEVLLPKEMPPAVEKRFLSRCEGLKRRLSDTVAPLLREKYEKSEEKRKKIVWKPFRLSVLVRVLSRSDAVLVYTETVSVFRKGKRLFFKESTVRQRVRDGKYLPRERSSEKEKKAKRKTKSEEKAKNC
jgi:hypothetical protein